MKPNIQTLEQSFIFSSLEEPDLEKIASIAISKSYKKNEMIFCQGDEGNSLFILKSGMVKVHLIDKSGREIILRILDDNDFFGEMALLDGKYRSATITAVEDSKALLVFREDFLKLIKKHPAISLNILATIIRRFRKTDEKISSFIFFDSYSKVAKVLLDIMEKRGRCDGNNVILDVKMSRVEMSEMAGVSRETFSRILRDYRSRGYLSIKGRKIIVHDEAMLRREII